MKKLYQLFLFFLFSTGSFSQNVDVALESPKYFAEDSSTNPFAVKHDSLLFKVPSALTFSEFPYNKKRVKLVAAANIFGYGASTVGLYSAWYSKYKQTSFHFFNDNAEWKQVDKVGHAYSAYMESYASMEMWRWTGVNRKQRILLGGLSGAGYQTIIEVLDGFSEGWGWSWGDFAANVAGSGLLVAQELAWDEQRVRFKFSSHPKTYHGEQLNKRANELYGKSFHQSFIKDYNGQTYWLSANLKSFLPQSNLPRWLNVAVGYGAEGMLGARENIWKDNTTNTTVNRTDIKRYRQWYLAPDIDFNRIRTKNKVLKITLGLLNVLKFPAPSLELSNNKLRWNWLYF